LGEVCHTLPCSYTVRISHHADLTQLHPIKKLAVVDGMVVVQKMTKKPATVVTVKD